MWPTLALITVRCSTCPPQQAPTPICSNYFPTTSTEPRKLVAHNNNFNNRTESVDFTQDDISVDCDKFHSVFGVSPAELAAFAAENAPQTESLWLRDRFASGSQELLDYPPYSRCETNSAPTSNNRTPQGRRGERMKKFKTCLMNGLISTLKGVVICCYTCYAVIPPIPSMITRKLAFHPPRGQPYYFVVGSAEGGGGALFANAKQAFGRPVRAVSFRGPRDPPDAPAPRERPLPDARPFVLKTERNNFLACVFVPCSRVSGLRIRRPRPEQGARLPDDGLHLKEPRHESVIIFCQPNSTNLRHFLINDHHFSFVSLRDVANRCGADVYAFDYSGFGISSGSASEANVYADLRAVFRFVRENRPNCDIYVMGFSIGTAVAVDLAASKPEGLAGLILMAPFTSGLRVLLDNPFRTTSFVTDAFKSLEKAPAIDVPVLIMHGTADDVIPYRHAVSLIFHLQKPMPIHLVPQRDHATIMRPSQYGPIKQFVWYQAGMYDQLFRRDQVLAEVADLFSMEEQRLNSEELVSSLGSQLTRDATAIHNMFESIRTTARLNARADFSTLFTDNERGRVAALRAHLGPDLLAQNPLFNDDLSLHRWILALDGNFDGIKEKFQEMGPAVASLDLFDREFEDVDEINEYFRAYHPTAEYYSGGLTGQDKDGDWIVCQVPGLIQPKQLAQSGRVADLFNGTLMSNTIFYNVVKQTERKTMRKCGLKIVYDLKGMGTPHLYPPTLKIYLNVVKYAQAMFPDLLKKIYVVNAPAMFVTLYNAVKSMFLSRTRDVVEILGQDTSSMLQELGPTNVYAYWGGSKAAAKGHPDYGTMMMAGPIPKHLRYKPEKNPYHQPDSRLVRVVVPARREREVRLRLGAGERGVWFVKTSGELDLSAWLGERLVRARFRVQTDFVPDYQAVRAEAAADLVLLLDNRFSRFARKHVYYYVGVAD